MTREDRYIVGLEDILSLRWQCTKCKTAVSFPLNETIQLPEICPGCRTLALEPNVRPEHRVFTAFVDALRAVVQLQQQQHKPGVQPGMLLFEFSSDQPATRH